MRKLGVAALATALATTTVAPASAQDTASVAINTKDGFDLFRLAFAVKRVATDTATPGNAAVAYASCTDCQTVAISIQVVFVTGDPTVVSPENLAIAINEYCSLCDTLATAYQFLFTTGGPVHLTAEGNRRLQDIRKALADLADSGLTGPEIQAKVDALMDELAEVLATEVVVVEPGQPKPTPSAAPPSTSPPPDPPASPSSEPSPSTSPSESPSSDPTTTP